MTTLFDVYKSVLILAVIAVGLAYVISPSAARQILVRIAGSILLYLVAGAALRCANIQPQIRMITASALTIGALVWIFDAARAKRLLARTAVLAGSLFALWTDINWMWADHIGKVVLMALSAGLVIFAVSRWANAK